MTIQSTKKNIKKAIGHGHSEQAAIADDDLNKLIRLAEAVELWVGAIGPLQDRIAKTDILIAFREL